MQIINSKVSKIDRLEEEIEKLKSKILPPEQPVESSSSSETASEAPVNTTEELKSPEPPVEAALDPNKAPHPYLLPRNKSSLKKQWNKKGKKKPVPTEKKQEEQPKQKEPVTTEPTKVEEPKNKGKKRKGISRELAALQNSQKRKKL